MRQDGRGATAGDAGRADVDARQRTTVREPDRLWRTVPRARIAVLIPCRNEEASIADVVAAFREALAGAVIVVADNGSTDATAARAEEAGARVIVEPARGKGRAVRRLFADVDADVYVMVDGDATYDAAAARPLVDAVARGGADMATGARVSDPGDRDSYRRGHRLGNAILTWIFQTLFGLPLTDTLTGYRAFSRRFVKSFPTSSTGFEIETDLNAHAAILGVPVVELPTRYASRQHGSASKLNTYRDGVRILRRNLLLFRDARPLLAFLLLALPWLAASVVLVAIPTIEYLRTGLVGRFPSLIAGVGALVVALLLWLAGIVNQRVSRNRTEAARLAYLSYDGPAVIRASGDPALDDVRPPSVDEGRTTNW
jgi:glycosyltransferase involved in cell wall biosynthesis